MITGLSSMVNREKKDAAQIVVWKGLNKTDGAADGYLSDCLNLSADNYPTLSPRKGRTAMAGTFTEPTALYSWDKLVYVDDNVLYYDGDPITNVSSGEKQFAVVGTRLCVWPDELIIDLTNGDFFTADDGFETSGVVGSITVTPDSITATADNLAKKAAQQKVAGDRWNGDQRQNIFYAYGTDVASVEACYDTANDAWDMAALGALESLKTCYYTDNTHFPGATKLAVGDIFIPSISPWGPNTYWLVYGYGYYDDDEEWQVKYPRKYDYNEDGYYGVITKREIPNPQYTTVQYTYNVYQVGMTAPLFSSKFYTADTVSVIGSKFGWYDKDKLSVLSMTDDPNTLTFGGNVFEIPSLYCLPENTANTGKNDFEYDNNGSSEFYEFTLTEDEAEKVNAENIALILLNDSGTYTVVCWDKVNHIEKFRVSAEKKNSHTSSTRYLGDDVYEYSTDTEQITISRDVPKLDYICTWNNRLWGVCNSEMNKVWNEEKEAWEETYSRVIYASALGQPWQFYDFSGLSTDSYAAVVGSKGDFTGITAYSRSLLAFKENMLYRVSGDYPSDYALYDYNVAGVKQGCNKSLRIINEVLYYKGRDGFYAYTGSTPSLISYVLGENDGNAKAAATERKYYAAMDYGDSGEILVYDTLTNTWYREDDTLAADITYYGGNVYFIKDNKIYIADDDDSTEDVVWSATFVRANETMHERKDFKWIRIRADMEEASTIMVEVSIDRGGFVTILPTTTVSGLKMFEIPIHNNRVDELVLRISGTGAGKIRSVVREFHEGSTYCK